MTLPSACLANAHFSQSCFTGKERDTESGNDYFDARYYSSAMGRFMSPDPMNAGADITNPQSWNMYSYVLNNPLIYIDPSGEECVWDDGSFDSADDKQTGSAGGCSGQGGTWVNPDLFENAMLTNGQWNSNYGDWSGQANSNLAQNWVSPAVTSDATPQNEMTSDATGVHFQFDPNFNYKDPSVTQAQVRATHLTPRPPLPTPGDCAVDPDSAIAAHQTAMQIWKAQNNIPAGSSAANDDDSGGGGGTAGAYLTFRPNGQAVLPSLRGAMANEAGAGGANGAALLADRFSGYVACRVQR
jgi:RHS repeat-associated protein